jgi:NAD(P)-dependent dehydrogenase (short-subunit alcohol dehydrogenase family)
MLIHHLSGSTSEWCLAGHHLPEHHAQRVEIRADVHANAGELLRASKLGCSGKYRLDEICRSGTCGARDKNQGYCPGGTATEIWGPVYPEMPAQRSEHTPEIVEPWLAERIPIGRAGLPADIANAFWLASSELSFVTDHALVIDGVSLRVFDGRKQLEALIS